MAKDKRSHHKKADTAKAKEKLAVQKEETKRTAMSPDQLKELESKRESLQDELRNVERQVREHSKWSAVKA